ncbi:MAG: M28 family peptidase [Rhodothermales bacterium]|nr:M28 family peptidase [Rhodothermales bacterium]
MYRFTVPFLLLFLIAGSSLAQSTDTSPEIPDPAGPTPTVTENPDLVKRYQETITPEDLASYLYVFASDYFEGRETSTRGQKLAATYLAGQYRKLGLTPMGTAAPHDSYAPAAYFQPVPLYTQKLKEAKLHVMQGSEVLSTVSYGPGITDGDAYLVFGSLEKSEGSVVFAGYGIGDDELGYNDFAALESEKISVGGKWVVLLGDEPLSDESTSLLPTSGNVPSSWTESPNNKLRGLLQLGGMPAGILIVNDLGPRAIDVKERAMERAEAITTEIGSLSLSENSGGRPFPPIYSVTASLADVIIGSNGKSIREIKKGIDSSLEPIVFEIDGVSLSSTLMMEASEAPSENVVAFIEGSDDALKDEVVVVSSHYDHIGIEADGDGDRINNGADDDGSGTVAILEMAEAFMTAKADGHGPRRSILFMNVTGEEKGLLGSQYFTDTDPLVPLENVVTNLNIDMIGRFDPGHPTGSENYVYIIGSNLISQELHDINQRVNELTATNLELDERFNSKDDPNQFYRRSDHWNFGKHSIPFIFFFTGTHADYHGVGDEPEKIEYERMTRITRLIFATAWQVANQDARPAISGEGFN